MLNDAGHRPTLKSSCLLRFLYLISLPGRWRGIKVLISGKGKSIYRVWFLILEPLSKTKDRMVDDEYRKDRSTANQDLSSLMVVGWVGHSVRRSRSLVACEADRSRSKRYLLESGTATVFRVLGTSAEPSLRRISERSHSCPVEQVWLNHIVFGRRASPRGQPRISREDDRQPF